MHASIASTFVPQLAKRLIECGVTMHCDPKSHSILKQEGMESQQVLQLYQEDQVPVSIDVFKKEYISLDVSMVVVNDLTTAIKHINTYGSHHTDCIVSKTQANIDRFFKEVDSAGVFCNCSTRFADGFRYGFGAEVGVSTNKLHARGPVGMEGLLSYKYKLIGDGHIVDDYNSKRRKFTHKNLPLK